MTDQSFITAGASPRVAALYTVASSIRENLAVLGQRLDELESVHHLPEYGETDSYYDRLFNILRDIDNDIVSTPAATLADRELHVAVANARACEDDDESIALVGTVFGLAA